MLFNKLCYRGSNSPRHLILKGTRRRNFQTTNTRMSSLSENRPTGIMLGGLIFEHSAKLDTKKTDLKGSIRNCTIKKEPTCWVPKGDPNMCCLKRWFLQIQHCVWYFPQHSAFFRWPWADEEEGGVWGGKDIRIPINTPRGMESVILSPFPIFQASLFIAPSSQSRYRTWISTIIFDGVWFDENKRMKKINGRKIRFCVKNRVLHAWWKLLLWIATALLVAPVAPATVV